MKNLYYVLLWVVILAQLSMVVVSLIEWIDFMQYEGFYFSENEQITSLVLLFSLIMIYHFFNDLRLNRVKNALRLDANILDNIEEGQTLVRLRRFKGDIPIMILNIIYGIVIIVLIGFAIDTMSRVDFTFIELLPRILVLLTAFTFSSLHIWYSIQHLKNMRS